MPRDLTIRNFKLFRELTLPRLGDVNLLVGRNNTGKTVLLEALMIQAALAHPGRLSEALRSRDEILRLNVEPEGRIRRESAVRIEALFYGPPDSPEGASFELLSREPSVSLRVNGLRAEGLPTRAIQAQLPVFEDSRSAGREENVGLEVIVDGNLSYTADIAQLSLVYPRISKETGGAIFVGIGGLPERDVASWWDALTLTDGEQSVYDWLQLLAPVERLSLVDRPDYSARMAMVKLRGQAKPVPLRSLGDGVRRVFQFALALQRTRPGDLLLLDEVENGVHYTALPGLWSFLIRAARTKGVQVVASTHSWDCVLGFQQATAQDGASASLIKLYREGEDIMASTFDESEMATVAREEIEVR